MSAAITPIAQALFESLYPLVRAAENPAYRTHLMRQLGWDEDAAAELVVLGPQIADWWKRGLEQQADLAKAIAAKDAAAQFVCAMLLLEIAFELGDAIVAQKGKPSDGPLQPGVRAALWNDLALALPEYLLLRWMRISKPILYWLLRITDVVELAPVDASQPARVAADVPRLRLERLGALFDEPEAYLKARYDWGFDAQALANPFRHDRRADAPLRHGRLLQVLQRLLADFGIDSRLDAVRQCHVGNGKPFAAGSQALPGARQLGVPLLHGPGSGKGPFAELGIALVPLPGSRGLDIVDGLYLTNFATAAKATTYDVGSGWRLQAGAGAVVSDAVALRLLPGQVRLDGALPSAGFEIVATGQPAAPWVLFGSNTGTRLELRGAETGLAVAQAGSDADVRLWASPRARDGGPGLLLVLSPGEGDSFLRQLLGDREIEAIFDLGFEWSSITGLALGGQVGACVTLPMQLPLGPVTLDEVHLCLGAGADGISLLAALSAHARLGPVVCSVKEIGVEIMIDWGAGTTKGRTFGALAINADFKPPTGIGLGIESPVVTAGGYLEFDRDAGEYGGTATLGIGPLSLTAVGLLDAKLPDPPGWSLLLSICAEFTPVPLGFGFTLNGVGGLVGIGRTIDPDALQRQLFAGGLDAVMFPEDPVGSGPAIIDTIRTLFPVAPGQTVFGPMVKIGWGAPTLIDADLGVMIELPDPVRIVIVGQIASDLPTQSIGLVQLHLDAYGAFDFSTLELSMAASLYDSWLVGYTLSGDMAIRACFGARPNLLLAIGGFNPRFDAPASFPALRPMTIGLRFDEDLRIEVQSYIALTTNTLQFGARIVIVAKLRILTLEGGTSFDALISYSPFSFTIDFAAYVDVLLGSKELLGVSIDATLRGPQPWVFNGDATFKVLGKDWHYDVRIQLAGRKTPVELEPVDVATLVRAALQDPAAWTQVPSAGGSGVQLAAPQAAVVQTASASALPTLMLRPDLPVEVRQRVAPLGVTLEKFGEHTIKGPTSITIERANFGTVTRGAAQLDEGIDDWFATGEYFKLDKTEKIAAPSFELLEAGQRIQPGAFVIGTSCDRNLAHEYSIIDRGLDRKLARRAKPRKGDTALATDARATRNARRKPREIVVEAPHVKLSRPAWKLIDTATAWTSGELASFATARTALEKRQHEQPKLKGRLRVVPAAAKEPA